MVNEKQVKCEPLLEHALNAILHSQPCTPARLAGKFWKENAVRRVLKLACSILACYLFRVLRMQTYVHIFIVLRPAC